MALADGENNCNMIFKFIFYFISYIHKKIDISFGQDHSCYWAGSILAGMTIATSIYVIVEILCILFSPQLGKYLVLSCAMDYFSYALILYIFFYFKKRNKWVDIYNEIQLSDRNKKIRYAVICLLFIVCINALFFICNDIICELNTQHGTNYANIIVSFLHLRYW